MLTGVSTMGGGGGTRGAKSGRSCEPSSQKIFSQILIWQKIFEENQAINVDYHIKHIL